MKKIKIDIEKFKSFFSKENIDKIKKLNYKDLFKKFINRVKNIKKEDIKLFYYSNKNTIYFLIFNFLILIWIALLFLFTIKIYTIKKEIDINLKKIEIVSSNSTNNLVNFIKSSRVRSIKSIADTVYVKMYDKFNKEKYTQILNSVKIFTLISMLEDSNNLYANYVKTLLISNNLSVSKNIKILYKNLLKIFNKVDYSNPIIISYISKFPKIKNILHNKGFEVYANVLSHLYEYELISILSDQNKLLSKLEKTYNNYQAPYKNFLTYIYFPRMDIWINPYSQKVNPDIFGSKYLNKADYIDLNLIKYWSNFFSQSYSWLLYQGEKNTITDIKLSNFKVDKKTDFANFWLNIRFNLPDDKSFYGLISKLTLTSNVKNIMLLNEFTYYLWQNIKSYLKGKLNNIKNNLSLGNKLLYLNFVECLNSDSNNCLNFYGCKNLSVCNKEDIFDDYAKKLLSDKKINDKKIQLLVEHIIEKLKNNSNYDLLNSSFYRFITNDYQNINDLDLLVWARLYDCIKENWYCWDIFDKDYTQIIKAIKQFANCENKNSVSISDDCKMKFIEKFNTNYFIAYTMVDRLGEINYSLLQRLKDVYNNIPNVLQLGKFMFTKLASTNLNWNMLVKYTSDISLSVYYKYVSSSEYNKILSYIGKNPCKSVTNGRQWSLSVAYNYVNNKYNQLYRANLWADAIYNLQKLLSIIKALQNNTRNAPLLDKLLANLQVYRIFKTRWYCK